MRAISLWQPWATLVREGKKTIETRMWPTNMRGDILICSTKKPKVSGHLCGYALCVVRLRDCRPMVRGDETAAMCDWEPGRWAWVLSNIRPTSPFPVTGKQGFFDVQLPCSDHCMDHGTSLLPGLGRPLFKEP